MWRGSMKKKKKKKGKAKGFLYFRWQYDYDSYVIQEPSVLVRNVVPYLSIISISCFYALKKNKEMRMWEEKSFQIKLAAHFWVFLLSHDEFSSVFL